ncbi:MAG: hypothetical protein AAF621_02545 [Pseudomonadota bacterium]
MSTIDNIRVQNVDADTQETDYNAKLSDYASNNLEGSEDAITKEDLTSMLSQMGISENEGLSELVDFMFENLTVTNDTVSLVDVAEFLDLDDDNNLELSEAKILADAILDENRNLAIDKDTGEASVPSVSIESDAGEIEIVYNETTGKLLYEYDAVKRNNLKKIFDDIVDGTLEVTPDNDVVKGMLFALYSNGIDKETIGDIYDLLASDDTETIAKLGDEIINIYLLADREGKLDEIDSAVANIEDHVDDVKDEIAAKEAAEAKAKEEAQAAKEAEEAAAAEAKAKEEAQAAKEAEEAAAAEAKAKEEAQAAKEAEEAAAAEAEAKKEAEEALDDEKARQAQAILDAIQDQIGQIADSFKENYTLQNGVIENVGDYIKDAIFAELENLTQGFFPANISEEEMKENIANALKPYLEKMNEEKIKDLLEPFVGMDIPPVVLINDDGKIIVGRDENGEILLDDETIFEPPLGAADGYLTDDNKVTEKGFEAIVERLESLLGDNHPLLAIMQRSESTLLDAMQDYILEEINSYDDPSAVIVQMINNLLNERMDVSDDSILRGEDGKLSTLGIIEALLRLTRVSDEYNLLDVEDMTPEEVNDILDAAGQDKPLVGGLSINELPLTIVEDPDREFNISDIMRDLLESARGVTLEVNAQDIIDDLFTAEAPLTKEEWESMIKTNKQGFKFINFADNVEIDAISNRYGNVDFKELERLFNYLDVQMDGKSFERLAEFIRSEADRTGDTERDTLIKVLNVIGAENARLSAKEINRVLAADFTVTAESPLTENQWRNQGIRKESDFRDVTIDLNDEENIAALADSEGNIDFEAFKTMIKAMGVDGDPESEAVSELFDRIMLTARLSPEKSELDVLKEMFQDPESGEGVISEHVIETELDIISETDAHSPKSEHYWENVILKNNSHGSRFFNFDDDIVTEALTDGRGNVDFSELEKVLGYMEVPMRGETFDRLVDHVKKQARNDVDKSQLDVLYETLNVIGTDNTLLSTREIERALEQFTAEAINPLDENQWQEIFEMSSRNSPTVDFLDQTVTEALSDEDGKIDFEEFKNLLKIMNVSVDLNGIGVERFFDDIRRTAERKGSTELTALLIMIDNSYTPPPGSARTTIFQPKADAIKLTDIIKAYERA